MDNTRKAETRMEEARMSLISDEPFFGVLALRLRIKADPATDVMSTNAKDLCFNPDWVMTAPFDHVKGVIAHEVMHCALGHPFRLADREFKRFNDACDYAINPLLIAAGMKLPADGLLDARFHNMSAEEIYNRLPSGGPGPGGQPGDKPGDKPGPGNGPKGPSTGTFETGVGDAEQALDEAENSAQIQEWQEALTQAITVAEANSQLAAGLKEWLIENGTVPVVNWREALRDFVSDNCPGGQSWLPPNRRYVHQGLYLPAPNDKKMGVLAIVNDVSGSTWSRQIYEKFSGEMAAIADETQPREVHVLYWDHDFEDYASFDEGEPVTFKTKRGGGGTNFEGVWPWLEKHGIDPDCVVFFTDMMTTRWGKEPAYPVLWAATTSHRAPFGQVVRLDKSI